MPVKKKSENSMPRNDLLDMIKGVCIFFILITHSQWSDYQRLHYFFPYWIDMAVPVFMIISGYVSAMSFEKRKIVQLRDAYQSHLIIGKIMRYSIPFMMVYLLELIPIIYSNGFYGIIRWIYGFIAGGAGPGVYYYPIMIQFVIVFPVIYFIVLKYDFAGVVLIGVFNACYEYIQFVYAMNESFYYYLLFRYMLLIGFGCYLYIGKTRPKYLVEWISFVFGGIFIYMVCYTNYEPKIIVYWTRTSFLAVLYVMPIIAWILRRNNSNRFSILLVLRYFGKASYNIFLVQKIYFGYLAPIIYSLGINGKIVLIINILICILVGILFYKIENPLTKHFVSYLNNIDFDKQWFSLWRKINNILTTKKV